MRWADKRYRSFSYEMKAIFGSKIIKLSLDGGFTCPNRDGTLGHKGCIFCGEEGAGEFAAPRELDIKSQLESQKEIMAKKWESGKYIAYFQSFTNTYSTYEDLKQKYNLAISEEGVVGLAIATRPDCLSEEVLDLLEEISKRTFLWVELGLQTIHGKTADFIRRGYDLACYDEAINQLSQRNIKVVTHLIFGLPGETRDDMLSSVKYVANTNTWGVKLHSLYIQKGTDLHEYYRKNPFKIPSKEEYISLIVDSIEHLPGNMVIHRLTGDGKRALMVEPLWSLEKRKVLAGIDQELKRRDSYQGQSLLHCSEVGTVPTIISGYTDLNTNNGIYFLELNDQGKGKLTHQYEHVQNPSYFHYSKKDNKLFVANEMEDSCKIDLYFIHENSLKYEKSLELPGSGLCHLLYDENREKLYASCYGSGEVYCVDGNLEKVYGKAYSNKSGTTSRAHGVAISHNGKWLISVDLGRSCLELYDLELDKPLPEQLKQRVNLGEGTGPRQAKWNEKDNKIYVVNEHENTLGVYEFNQELGEITKEIARLKTSFSKDNVKNYPSSCLITKNRKWLLLANRGYNTISIFKIDQGGMPVLYKEHSCFGDWPRYISLTDDEKFLLVANQNSHEVSILNYDQEAGELALADIIEVANPSCIDQKV